MVVANDNVDPDESSTTLRDWAKIADGVYSFGLVPGSTDPATSSPLLATACAMTREAAVPAAMDGRLSRALPSPSAETVGTITRINVAIHSACERHRYLETQELGQFFSGLLVELEQPTRRIHIRAMASLRDITEPIMLPMPSLVPVSNIPRNEPITPDITEKGTANQQKASMHTPTIDPIAKDMTYFNDEQKRLCH